MTESQANGISRILYIENDRTYCNYLQKQVAQHAGFSGKIEIIPAVWVEEAYNILKKGNIHGVIIDLQIYNCDKKTLADFDAQPLDLSGYTPAEFAGIGLILLMQEFYEHIPLIPKIVISNYDFDYYECYYAQMKGSKMNAKKHPDFGANAFTAIRWFEKIKL